MHDDGDEEIDAVTARAIQLLAAADVYASENRSPRARRGWHDPAILAIVIAMITLMVLAFGYLRLTQVGDRLTQVADDNRRLSTQNSDLLQQVNSCVDPSGECAKRGAENTGKAVASIVSAVSVAICTAVNPTDHQDARQCVVAVTAAIRSTMAD